MDSHPILYAIVPYSIQSKLFANIDSLLNNFLKYNKLDKESYAMVREIFKNNLKINDNYTKYIFQYYKLFEDKTLSNSMFSKSYKKLQSIFKDVYINTEVFLTLPSILQLTELEYNTFKNYLDKTTDDKISIQTYINIPFINSSIKEILFYEIIGFSYFSFQTLPNDNSLYIYGFKLTPLKQKMLFDIFIFSNEKKKELEHYFFNVNKLYEAIHTLRIKDIETHWKYSPDPIFKRVTENFYKSMSQSFQLQSIMESYYKEKYTIKYDSPILYKISSNNDLTKASPTIFYKFLEILNVMCLEENPSIRKKIITTLLYNNYTDGLTIQLLLNDIESSRMDSLSLKNANAIGFIRLEWINGAYRHTPLSITHTKTVEDHLKLNYLCKDPVKSLYPITNYSSNKDLFLPISYTPNIQTIYSIIFNTIIIPSIVNDINKNN